MQSHQDLRPVRTASRHAGPIAVAFLAAACATGENSSALRQLPPAPFVVAVETVAPAATKEGMGFAATSAEMQSMLAEELRALDASSRVLQAGEPGAKEADLSVRVVPQGSIDFEHAGTANFLGAGGLWLITWFGGLLVPDSTYTVRMQGTCTFKPAGGSEKTKLLKLTSDEVDLSFFERNDLFSFPGLQSLVLPPFWTSDQSTKTCQSLSRSSMRLAARQIATELKQNFELRADRDLDCSLRAENLTNGQQVDKPSLDIVVVAKWSTREPVDTVSVSVNDAEWVALTKGAVAGNSAKFEGVLQNLRTGDENWIRIQAVGANTYKRTLRLGKKP